MSDNIEEIIRLRENAIQSLQEEYRQLNAELQMIQGRLTEINTQLNRLGTGKQVSQQVDEKDAVTKRRIRKNIPPEQQEAALKVHFTQKSKGVLNTYQRLMEKISAFGEGITVSPAKKSINLRAGNGKTFCSFVVWKAKLTIYIDIPQKAIADPFRMTEDCSEIGHWGTGDTRFDLQIGRDITNAVELIRQAWQYQSREGK